MSTTTSNGRDNRSTSELIRDLSDQSTRLIHEEMALARAEMTQKGAQAGFGIGLFGGAGILSLYALGALIAAGILLLSTAMKAWLAAVIVAGGLLIVAGTAGLVGKARLARAAPPVPEATIETTKQDVETVRSSLRKGRHEHV
ncbi:MAG TPA: phage holin family protein [Solirubrobacteraceae bacterium]|nr:phage holin family protein [Solirubrobacteraceae bacterium]